jgi:hypothetical protein
MDRFANDKLAALKARIELLFAKAAAGSKSGPSRYPAGTPKGGQFMPKGGAAGGGDGKMTLRSEPAPSNTKMTSAFSAARVETSNVNAKSHNGRVDAIEKAYAAGDQKSILGMSFGTNTYAKRQCKLANQALEAMGSEHRVAPGQKANAHAGMSGPTKPADAPKPPAAAAPPAAESAPKPKGGSSYKQAKTVDDAISQLKALGMKDVIKVGATEQADWMKQKIANAPPEKKAFYEKYYGPKPTKHRMSDASFLKVMNAIGPEVARLNDQFPGFMATAVLVQKSTGSKALGTYSHSGASIRMATVETQEKAAQSSIKYQQGSPAKTMTNPVTGKTYVVSSEKPPQKVPWTVRTDDSVTVATADTWRHEAAHALDYSKGAATYGGAITQRLAAAMGGNAKLMKFTADNVSRYGGTKPQEAGAELITLYTSKTYKRGTLPKEIESILDDEFKKLASLKKMLMDISKAEIDYLNDDDIIVDIPEPPPGYELIKQEGMDIQFRAPDGGIVSFWDLVEVGYYGFDDEE